MIAEMTSSRYECDRDASYAWLRHHVHHAGRRERITHQRRGDQHT